MFRLLRPLEPELRDEEFVALLIGEFVQFDLDADLQSVTPGKRGGYKQVVAKRAKTAAPLKEVERPAARTEARSEREPRESVGHLPRKKRRKARPPKKTGK